MARVVHELVRHLGRIAARGELEHLADAELLRRFSADHDPAVFEILVRRHGPMVLDTCRRVLGRQADAEDTFQATFLTLVRSARSVRSGTSLAGWLYRTARRASIRICRQTARRERREHQVARPEAVTVDDAERADWRAFLDHEISCLPRHYREVIVLCYLEDRACGDVARELGCPLGTLHSRLARAKDQLRVRLGTRGVAVPAIVAATVSEQLARATVAAAVELAGGMAGAGSAAGVVLSQGGWESMILFKTKYVVAVVLTVVVFGTGAMLLKHPTATATPTASLRAEPTLEELKRENERLRREVAGLKQQLAEVESALRRPPPPRADDTPPSDGEVLRAMPKVVKVEGTEVFRDDVVITKEKLLDRLDPPRSYPLVGVAQLRRTLWACTTHYTEIVEKTVPTPSRVQSQRVEVIYIEKNEIVRIPTGTK